MSSSLPASVPVYTHHYLSSALGCVQHLPTRPRLCSEHLLTMLSSLVSRTGVIRAYSTIRVAQKDGLRTITLNRPDKLNAFNNSMYTEVLEDLGLAAEDPHTVVTVLTGEGDEPPRRLSCCRKLLQQRQRPLLLL